MDACRLSLCLSFPSAIIFKKSRVDFRETAKAFASDVRTTPIYFGWLPKTGDLATGGSLPHFPFSLSSETDAVEEYYVLQTNVLYRTHQVLS